MFIKGYVFRQFSAIYSEFIIIDGSGILTLCEKISKTSIGYSYYLALV